MKLEEGCLILDVDDLGMLLSDMKDGISLLDSFQSQLDLFRINKENVFEVHAFAPDIEPYEQVLFSVISML